MGVKAKHGGVDVGVFAVAHCGCDWPILLQKSKIERPQKSRQSRFLDLSGAALPFRATAKVGGRFRMKPYGPSHRRA
jgi:hypothetical protein